ncbi:MAG: PopZ family protein [Bosea sp. (in: a-proteobacteria)]
MSAQPKPNEPSMEEILASIRRIISDDDKPAEAPTPAPAQDDDLRALLAGAAAIQPSAPIAEEDDVLDLGAEAEPLLEPEPPATPVELHDIEFLEPETLQAEPAPEPEPVAAPYIPPQPQPQAPQQAAIQPFDMAQLLSDQTSSAVTNAFGQLAHTVLSNNARTLEDLVKDMLKPMLKTWLDDNLPTMVERLVRAEIERVARGGRS